MSDYPQCPMCGQGGPEKEFDYQVGIRGSKEDSFGSFMDAAIDRGYTEEQAEKMGEKLGAAYDVGYDGFLNVEFKDNKLTIESIMMNGKKFLPEDDEEE